MFKMQQELTSIVVPKTGIMDSDLSLSAIGLYATLFARGSKFNKDLSTITTSSKEEIESAIKELNDAGYIENGNDFLRILRKPTKKKAKIEKKDIKPKKQKPLFTQMIEAIYQRKYDKEVTALVINYMKMRLSPTKDSRFHGSFFNLGALNNLLNVLDTIENKKEAVSIAIQNEYFKFFEPQKSSFDTADIQEVSQEEADRIRAKLGRL